MKEVRTICPFCGAGCGYKVIVEGETIKVSRRPQHPIAQGILCPKGTFSRKLARHEKRLRKPLIRKGSKLVEASRDEALKLIAERIKEVMKDDPYRIGFFASAKLSNEENYLIQKLARAVIGTPNVDHCVRLCHAPSAAALLKALGSGAMTNPITDMLNAKTILIAGYNPFNSHPALYRRLVRAKKNAKIIVIDPRKSRTARLADVHLQPYPGTDTVLLNAMAKVIVEHGRVDEEFVKNRTVGFEEYLERIKQIDLEEASRITGVPLELIEKAAEIYATNKPSTIYRGMGITQSVNGFNNVLGLINLALLTGNIGKPGAGLCPARGQSNVQGACDMGCMPNMFPGYKVVNEENAKYYAEIRKSDRVPSEPGLVTREMIEALDKGKLDVLYIVGENPAVSEPENSKAAKALQEADLVVVQEILRTETVELADVVLPAALRLEKEGSVTNTERRVQRFFKAIEPIGEAMSDFEIITRLAKLLGADRNYTHVGQVTDEIASVVPIYRGITYELLQKREEGVIRPYDPETGKSEEIFYTERFKTPDGKARFIFPERIRKEHLRPDEEYPFLLISYRLLEHRNSGAMTRIIPELLRMAPEARLLMNTKDAERLGLNDGQMVTVESRRGKAKVRLRVSDDVREGVVAMPYHFIETNRLTPTCVDPVTKMPNFKGVPVKVY